MKYFHFALLAAAVLVVSLMLVNIVQGPSQVAFAQEGGVVNQSEGPPVHPYSLEMFYTGGGLLEYTCRARSWQPAFTWSFSSGALTDITVATNVGTATFAASHGLVVGNPVSVTGSATSALNKNYIVATTPTGTTLTFATSAVADGTYTTGLVVSTTAPRTNATVWTIEKMVYSGSNLVRKRYSPIGKVKCDDRAVVSYQ